MPLSSNISIAANAAGIADAFRLAQICDDDGDNQIAWLSDHYAEWLGVIEQIVEAAEAMEAVRIEAGNQASWGGVLPRIYDAWDAVGNALWDRIGTHSASDIARQALVQLAEEGPSEDD